MEKDIKAIKRTDGLYNMYTEVGFIGNVMEYQLEKARKMLEKTNMGLDFIINCISKIRNL